MRIFVSSAGASLEPQIRAYAEFRIFSALARYDGVSNARVTLSDEAGGGMRCAVTVDLDTSASIRALARGAHAAGTIDRAAERVAHLMRRRSQPEITAAAR